MFKEKSETYLSELAEQLSQSWSKLGARVCWWNSYKELNILDLDDPGIAKEAACQSTVEGKPTAFVSSSGNGNAFPVFSNGRCLGSILCIFPPNLLEQSQALFEIFHKNIDHLHTNFRTENELTDLSRELSGSYEELSLIYKLGEHFQITDDPATFLNGFAEELMELIQAQGLLLLINHRLSGGETCLQVGNMPVPGEGAKAVCRYLTQITGTRRETLILSDISTHPSLVRIFQNTEVGIMARPILVEDTPLGILVAVGTNQYDGFDSTDAKLFGTIGEQTASFLQNSFLLADIQELLTGLLTSLVNAIDAKDPCTRGHSQRVAFIGRRIAESLELSPKECAQVYMAGLLHDIGKIGISDHVLTKPGKLTPEEFAIIQQHPVIGAKIISSVRPLQNILPGVLHHHERYDGKGYCEGLTGEQIPLMGMIVGLADCFDAITSERTYHSAKSFTDAINEVRQCSGSQFSPAVAQALLNYDLDKLEHDLKSIGDHNHEIQALPSLNWIE
ncbi:MAG: HD domain-containing phosphohydrolase [Phycisphaerae bacterium]